MLESEAMKKSFCGNRTQTNRNPPSTQPTKSHWFTIRTLNMSHVTTVYVFSDSFRKRKSNDSLDCQVQEIRHVHACVHVLARASHLPTHLRAHCLDGVLQKIVILNGRMTDQFNARVHLLLSYIFVTPSTCFSIFLLFVTSKLDNID